MRAANECSWHRTNHLSAIVAAIRTGDAFSKGRDFAAWLGLVPKQISTGDRTILGKILKRGNRYLRVLFVQAAWVVRVKPKWVGSKAPFRVRIGHVRFSNRPFGVKHFQTIHHHCSVDVAHGLVLLFGIGTTALPLWDSRTRWNNLLRGLAVRLTAGPSGHANSPHPSSREGHHSTALWSSSFLLSDVILHGFHAATACSLVHRNSVPSTQIMVWTGRAPTE